MFIPSKIASSNNKTSSKDDKSKSGQCKKDKAEDTNPTTGPGNDVSVHLVHLDASASNLSTPSKKGSTAAHQAKHLKQQYSNNKDLKLVNICPAIQLVADGSHLDVDALAQDLLSYAKTYHKWNSNSVPLHLFDTVFQALWKHISSNSVRNMLWNTVIDLYYNLDNFTRIMFRPVMEKVHNFPLPFPQAIVLIVAEWWPLMPRKSQ